jgi:hypothetical protein
VDERTLLLHRRGADGAAAFFVLHFAPEACTARLRLPPGPWRRVLDSAEARFGGPGAKSPALFPAPRGGWIEIEVAGHGAVVYLKTPTATAIATGKSGAADDDRRELVGAA